jgi:hypothetical protein
MVISMEAGVDTGSALVPDVLCSPIKSMKVVGVCPAL